MTHEFYLLDADTTLYLSHPQYCRLINYTPRSPDLAIQQVDTPLEDGDRVTLVTRRNVTDVLEVEFVAASKTALQTLVNQYEEMLLRAERRQRLNAGNRVYLEVNIDSDTYAWWSEVLAGRLELASDALALWPNVSVSARLYLTRRPWFETSVPIAISCTSKATTSPTVNGVSIANHNDSGHGNYIQIASTQIAGVMPTPAKVQLINTDGDFRSYRNVYLATNAFSDAANFTHILEGEAVVTGHGTIVGSSGTNSSSSYITRTFTGTSDFLWDLSSTLLGKTQGRWFRLLVRFYSFSTPGPIYIKPEIRDNSGLLTLYEGDEVQLPASSAALLDLGAVPLPPGGYNTAWAGQTLFLGLRSASSVTVAIDYVQLTPQDSYRHIVQRGMQIADGDSIVDDGIEGLTYSTESSLNHPIYAPRGDPLLLYPGKTQRIYVLHDEGSTSVIADTFTAKVWYKQRRLTV